MKKDVIVAVFIGFLLGSISAVSLVKLPDILKQNSKSISTVVINNITPSPVNQNDIASKLIVTNPTDFSILDNSTASISGETNPGSMVVAETSSESVVSQVNGSGSFSVKLKLLEGANSIFLTSYNALNEAKSVTLTLFYTEENL